MDVRFWPEADKCNVVPRYVDKGPEGSAGYSEGRLPKGGQEPLSRRLAMVRIGVRPSSRGG